MIVIRATDEADLVQQLLPRFQHDEDNDGQVVLYTDCRFIVGDGDGEPVWKVVPFVDEPWPVGTGTKAPGQPMTIAETLALFGETPCECEACLTGEREIVEEHGLHQLALITTWAPAVLDSLGLPRCSTVDDGLCQTCGLEAYDPDCGCICDCHHTCE